MKEKKEFESDLDMKEYICNEWNLHGDLFGRDDIVIYGEPINDKRTGWKDTRMVCIKRLKEEDYIVKYGVPQCIGMCATDYKI